MQSISPIGGPFVWVPQGLHTPYPDLELKLKVPMRNKQVVKHRSGNQKRNEKLQFFWSQASTCEPCVPDWPRTFRHWVMFERQQWLSPSWLLYRNGGFQTVDIWSSNATRSSSRERASRKQALLASRFNSKSWGFDINDQQYTTLFTPYDNENF